MKVWPLREKPFLDGRTVVVFQVLRYDGRREDLVETTHITSPELALKQIEKAIRRGSAVILTDQETGKSVAFDLDDEDGERSMYPNWGTPQQDRIPVEQFPWEE